MEDPIENLKRLLVYGVIAILGVLISIVIFKKLGVINDSPQETMESNIVENTQEASITYTTLLELNDFENGSDYEVRVDSLGKTTVLLNGEVSSLMSNRTVHEDIISFNPELGAENKIEDTSEFVRIPITRSLKNREENKGGQEENGEAGLDGESETSGEELKAGSSESEPQSREPEPQSSEPETQSIGINTEMIAQMGTDENSSLESDLSESETEGLNGQASINTQQIEESKAVESKEFVGMYDTVAYKIDLGTSERYVSYLLETGTVLRNIKTPDYCIYYIRNGVNIRKIIVNTEYTIVGTLKEGTKLCNIEDLLNE